MDASIMPFSLSSAWLDGAWLERAAYLMVTLMITRFMAVSVGRACGFYSPDQYHRWPRLPWRPVFEAYIVAPAEPSTPDSSAFQAYCSQNFYP